MALNISTKRNGDKLSATEFNAVVDEINSNGRKIDTLQQSNNNFSTDLASVMKEQKSQKATIKTLNEKSVKMVALTQEEYDALASDGNVDEETYYNILEEE